MPSPPPPTPPPRPPPPSTPHRFHAASFYALAPPASLPALRACLGNVPSLPITLLPTGGGGPAPSSPPPPITALARPAWVSGTARALAAPASYEPPPLTPAVQAGRWVAASLEAGVGGGDLPASVVLVAGARRAAALRDGAAGAVALTLGGSGSEGEEGAAGGGPAHALFSDDLTALAAGGWLGLEAVVVPTGGGRGDSGAAAGRLVRALAGARTRTTDNGTCAPRGVPARPPPAPALLLFNPPTGRLGDPAPLAAALESAAAATGLAFRAVGGPVGAEEGASTLETTLAALASSLAGARVIVGRGGPDLAAVAAAAPPGASLVELAPVEPHPAVASVVAARAAGGPPTALASHALCTPHPPGGPVGSHLAWADAGEGRRYGAWARPDCAVAALHGGDCAAAAARAALVVGGVGEGVGAGGSEHASSSLAAVVDAALRGLYAAEVAAGVGLA